MSTSGSSAGNGTLFIGVSTRDAQRRPVHLNPARLEALTAWIDQYRLVREEQFRSLDAVLESSAGQAAPTAKDRK